MKQVSLQSAEGASREYLLAVHKFFKDIPEIVCIEDIYYMRSTKTRVYFYIGEIVHESYTFTANVFVRKNSRKVEFCSEITGEAITEQYLEMFKNSTFKENNAWD